MNVSSGWSNFHEAATLHLSAFNACAALFCSSGPAKEDEEKVSCVLLKFMAL